MEKEKKNKLNIFDLELLNSYTESYFKIEPNFKLVTFLAKDKLEFNTKMIAFYDSQKMEEILNYFVLYYLKQNK